MALENVITTLVLDVIDHDQTQGVVKAIALDSKTRYVQATIVQHGLNYDVDPNAVVTLTILRPDNVGVQITGSVVDVDNADRTGTIKGVYAELTQAALAKSGNLKAQFKMTVGEQILRTEIFQVKNGVALDAETSEWAGEYQGYNLDELVQNVNESSAKVDAMEQDVSELKSGLNDAIKDSFEVYPSLRPTLTGGYVNANNNTIVASENFGITAPIPVKKGQTIKLTATGYGTSVGMIATCNVDNTTRTTKVRSIDNDEHTYTYTVEEDGYVICSVKTLYDTKYELSIIMNYYGLFDDVNMYSDILQVVSAGTVDKSIERNISGSYVFPDGTVKQSGATFISQPIDLYPGQTLTFNARGYNRDIAMISEYDSASDTYTPLVISVDSTDRTYTYTALDKVTVRCSAVYYASGQNVPYSATITMPDTDSIRIRTLENKVNANSNEIIQYPQLFDNIVCVGDSLTVGYDGSGDTPLVKNYPHFLKKLADAEITKKAHGGWTAKQIWDGEISIATDLATYDCAIIFLGTNGGLTDTVSTDCKADYTQNADTNTGCYGKIIGKIKADAPNCRIFCVAGVNDYVRRSTTMNPAVRALAEFYNVGLIDVENCIMSDNGASVSMERYLYRPVDGIHYNALGYMTMANMFYNSMREFMGNHRTMYDDYNSN